MVNRYAEKSPQWGWRANAICSENHKAVEVNPEPGPWELASQCPESPKEEEPEEIDYSKLLPTPEDDDGFYREPLPREREPELPPLPPEPEVEEPLPDVSEEIESPPTSDTPPRNYDRFQYRSQFDPTNNANEAIRNNSCGPTALGEAMSALGKDIPTSQLIDECGVNQSDGANLGRLGSVANKHLPNSHRPWGFTYTFSPMKYLQQNVGKDSFVIAAIHDPGIGTDPEAGHYMLVHDISGGQVHCIDPAGGRDRSYSLAQFESVWGNQHHGCLVIKK